ncbi:MAG: DUF481 domain-containing protein [Flavobacteriales bacterium]|nr:DUF481 domain-containing protein [Flavobacteriales bacterium]
MKKSITILFFVLLSSAYSFGQNDSLKIRTEIGVRGRLQTGNLNQFAINPNAKLGISKDKFNTEFQADYQYLNINDFVVKSDFWSSGIYQHRPNRRMYPMAIARYGFSKSYRINQSILSGIGAGVNIRKKSPTDLIQLNAFTGYMNIEFENDIKHISIVGGLLIKMMHSISKRIHVLWDLNSYHSSTDNQFWGLYNLVMIQYKIHKNIALNLSYNSTHNNKTIVGMKKTNTLMLFGFNYQYKQ